MKMKRLIYFVQQRDALPEHVRGEKSLACCTSSKGPLEQIGQLYSPIRGPVSLTYEPKHQDWIPYPGQDGCWLGVDREGYVNPEQLERDTMLAGGKLVEICGEQWRIPVARSFLNESSLPMVRMYGENGERIWKVESGHDALIAAAEKTLQHIRKEYEATPEDIEEWMALGVGANYRLGLPELVQLQMVTPGSIRKVLHALIDWDGAQKLMEQLG